MHNTLASILAVCGHFLMGAVFVRGGIMHFLSFASTTKEVSDRGVPFPSLVMSFGSVFQIIFGAFLAVGVAVSVSAILLLAFTIVASFMLLNFWDKQGPSRDAAKTNFESNVAIAGGLLLTAVQALH